MVVVAVIIIISYRFIVVPTGKDAEENGENDKEDIEGVPAGFDGGGGGGGAKEAGSGGEERWHGEEEERDGEDGKQNDE